MKNLTENPACIYEMQTKKTEGNVFHSTHISANSLFFQRRAWRQNKKQEWGRQREREGGNKWHLVERIK